MSQKEVRKIAVFPGTFDPITKGHVDILHRALPLFDEIIIAIGSNSVKTALFDLDVRLNWLRDVFRDEPKIRVDQFEGLTVHYCTKIGANHLIRGLRNASDFDYEKTISQLNNIVGDNVDTVFFISKPEYSHISSTIVREIIKGRGNIEAFIPSEIKVDYDSID